MSHNNRDNRDSERERPDGHTRAFLKHKRERERETPAIAHPLGARTRSKRAGLHGLQNLQHLLVLHHDLLLVEPVPCQLRTLLDPLRLPSWAYA